MRKLSVYTFLLLSLMLLAIGCSQQAATTTAVVATNEIATTILNSYLVFHTAVGQTVELTVLRGNEEVVLPLTLAARP